MKTFLAFVLLSLSIPQTQTPSQDRSGVEILSIDYEFKMVERDGFLPGMVSNQPPVLNPNPNFGRVDKNESPVLANQREKQRLSDASGWKKKNMSGGSLLTVPVYVFRAQMKNDTARSITRLIWAYQPSVNSPDLPAKEFLCNVRMGPSETKVVKVISPIPRSRVVSASDSGTPPAPQKPSLKEMVVNQVQFSDGTFWQSPNWNPIILLRQGAKKLGKGKCIAL